METNIGQKEIDYIVTNAEWVSAILRDRFTPEYSIENVDSGFCDGINARLEKLNANHEPLLTIRIVETAIQMNKNRNQK